MTSPRGSNGRVRAVPNLENVTLHLLARMGLLVNLLHEDPPLAANYIRPYCQFEVPLVVSNLPRVTVCWVLSQANWRHGFPFTMAGCFQGSNCRSGCRSIGRGSQWVPGIQVAPPIQATSRILGYWQSLSWNTFCSHLGIAGTQGARTTSNVHTSGALTMLLECQKVVCVPLLVNAMGSSHCIFQTPMDPRMWQSLGKVVTAYSIIQGQPTSDHNCTFREEEGSQHRCVLLALCPHWFV
mmetsp:Transcript_78053/g.137736  ORF Transcript_78053/g.137736 Transcript_78053/m.137736 type:complete len:239 (+) Transcript_78053:402-1118(+)